MRSAIPEATLEQLGLANANFGFPFEPQYCAMDDGSDCPGRCWHLFEDLPTFDPVTLSWQNEGNAWEAGVDDSEDLHDIPEFQRWVKDDFSLVRVVKTATAAPQYHPLAYMTPAVSDKVMDEKQQDQRAMANMIQPTEVKPYDLNQFKPFETIMFGQPPGVRVTRESLAQFQVMEGIESPSPGALAFLASIEAQTNKLE